MAKGAEIPHIQFEFQNVVSVVVAVVYPNTATAWGMIACGNHTVIPAKAYLLRLATL